MSVRLYLIRHAESIWNAEGRVQGQADPPLSERGLSQAGQVADRFRGQPIAALYSSPLQRARQTAECIAGTIGRPVQVEERLKEHNMGLFTGLVWMEIAQQFPEFAAAWMHQAMDMPGGEKQHVFRARATGVIEDIAARHPDSRVIVVSHSGIFGEYLAHLLGLHPEKRHPFRFENASISEVEVGSSLLRIHRLNDVGHLLDAAPPGPSLIPAHAADDSPLDAEDPLNEDDHANDPASV
ncbi:MAG TPA: histidine phosphatase family protein [Anaerolineae bacterium]